MTVIETEVLRVKVACCHLENILSLYHRPFLKNGGNKKIIDEIERWENFSFYLHQLFQCPIKTPTSNLGICGSKKYPYPPQRESFDGEGRGWLQGSELWREELGKSGTSKQVGLGVELKNHPLGGGEGVGCKSLTFALIPAFNQENTIFNSRENYLHVPQNSCPPSVWTTMQ